MVLFNPAVCFSYSLVMVAVAHPVDKAFPGSIRPSPNAYQRFNISCAGSARRFSHYNGICRFSLTQIVSIYVMLLIFKELTPPSPHPQKNGSIPSLVYPSLSPSGTLLSGLILPVRPVRRETGRTASEIIIILIIIVTTKPVK